MDEMIEVVSDDGLNYIEIVSDNGFNYVEIVGDAVILDGEFSIEQLEAVIELLKRAQA